MKRTILVICALGAVAAAGFYLSKNMFEFDAERPALETPALEPLSGRVSRVTVPVSVPVAAVGEALERAAPKRESGSREAAFGGPFARGEIRWDLRRSGLRVSGRGGALGVAAEISGEARAAGVLRLIKKFEFSERGDFLATVSLAARPEFEADWRVSPNLSETEIDIKRADIAVRRVGPLDVSGHILPGIESAVRRLRGKLDAHLARNDFLERAARKGWKSLCASTPLGADREFWLETKPVAARAADIRIDRENIRFTLGVDLMARVLSERTRPDCPFPPTLLVEKPGPEGFSVVLPVKIDYETLGERLAGEIVGKSFGKSVSIVVEKIGIRPHGKLLLLETRVAAETDYLSGSRTGGTLYLLAEPRLDTEAQTLALENVKLDVDSRNALFSIAGKLAEPALLDAVSRRVPFDLGPKLEELRGEAGDAISALSSDAVSVSGEVNRVRLTRLDVGPGHLRAVLTAEGRVSAEVLAVP